MEPDELLVGVSFPIWGGRSGFAVEEFARRHGDFAIAGAAIGVELDDDDRIRALRDRPHRPRVDARARDAAEAELAGPPDRATSSPRRSVAWRWPASTSVPADLHGSAGVPHAGRRGDGGARVDDGRARRRADG